MQITEDITVILERNLTRAADIIGHFKQLAVDQVSENRRRFKLVDVISDTLSAVSPQIRKTPYHIALDLDSSIEMDSYPGAISQVLTNFVTNALMHAFDGRPSGTMTIHSVKDGEDALKLSFRDDGNGIAADRISRIFDPFFTTKFGRGGTGLGLYVAYNQVQEILGGRLTVSSEPGHGTCFDLFLPCAAPARKTAC
ncbi:sensor histidine kinase [Rhodoferax sp. UBA5149]|uniref:sensor histidine kinase n=1 Tax=Rhodoferax sp. UBA5149 TaxID=1947379 RepID=UPI0025E077CA|nr:HAMP domain-containing sensor histidine kinase [Rhodoferax sp. UBA5149]